MGKYAGGSAAKDESRGKVFDRTEALLGSKFWSGKHLYLASSEVGDVREALRRGVSPKNIIGVDKNRAAATEGQRRAPTVRIIKARAADVAKTTSFDFVFYDSCSPIHNKDFAELLKIMPKVNPDGVLAYTFMVGREIGDLDVRALAFASGNTQKYVREILKGMFPDGLGIAAGASDTSVAYWEGYEKIQARFQMVYCVLSELDQSSDWMWVDSFAYKNPNNIWFCTILMKKFNFSMPREYSWISGLNVGQAYDSTHGWQMMG